MLHFDTSKSTIGLLTPPRRYQATYVSENRVLDSRSNVSQGFVWSSEIRMALLRNKNERGWWIERMEVIIDEIVEPQKLSVNKRSGSRCNALLVPIVPIRLEHLKSQVNGRGGHASNLGSNDTTHRDSTLVRGSMATLSCLVPESWISKCQRFDVFETRIRMRICGEEKRVQLCSLLPTL